MFASEREQCKLLVEETKWGDGKLHLQSAWPSGADEGSEVPKTLEDYHINNNRDNGILNIFYTNADSFLNKRQELSFLLNFFI